LENAFQGLSKYAIDTHPYLSPKKNYLPDTTKMTGTAGLTLPPLPSQATIYSC